MDLNPIRIWFNDYGSAGLKYFSDDSDEEENDGDGARSRAADSEAE